jgi:SAM-dependent methyltransferase
LLTQSIIRPLGVRDWLDRASRAYAPTRRVRFAFAQKALEQFAGARPISVLDAGCSEGLFSELLGRRHPAWSLDAVDIDASVIKLAEAEIRRQNLRNVELRVGDLATDLPEAAYDAVAALECLTLVDDDEAALASMARALKPGGLLVAHVPDKYWRPLLSSRDSFPGERRHGYTVTEIEALVQKAHLELRLIKPTTRNLGRLGRELAARIDRASLGARLVWFPFAVLISRLERFGLTWGPASSYYFEAVLRKAPDVRS